MRDYSATEAANEGAGSPPQEGWLSSANRVQFDDLLAKLKTSETKESVSRYHAIIEGYLLGLLDCNHVSKEHYDIVMLYLHDVAIKRLKSVKVGRRP